MSKLQVLSKDQVAELWTWNEKVQNHIMSILRSQMKVSKTCLKIYLITSEPHNLKLLFIDLTYRLAYDINITRLFFADV